MSKEFQDRVVIVLGAGSVGPGWGNGKATAYRFAQEGARVLCVDLNEAAAEETVAIITNEGGTALAHKADVSRSDDIEALVARCLETWGRIDVLHHNVGLAKVGGCVDLPEEEWRRIMDVNLTSAFLACKHVLPVMERQGKGAIIATGSIAGIRYTGVPYVTYYASKAALQHMMTSVALEYADRGIRANTVLPGLMQTPMIFQGLPDAYAAGDADRMIEVRNAQCPTGKMGDAWDVAEAVLFLASDRAKYITGHDPDGRWWHHPEIRLRSIPMTACITGWSHSAFGKLDMAEVEDLLAMVAGDAIADAGLSPEDIDAVFLGHFNGGFTDQDFTASLVYNSVPGLRFKPATRLENACATGSAAVHAGMDAIAAGRARNVLVLGVEKMTGRSSREIGDILLRACYRKEEAATEGGFAGMFAQITDIYFDRYGDKSEALAHIAAKNHRNGVDNPYAQMRRDLGFDFCNQVSDKNPIVAGRLRRTDCSLVSDGAAALVLTAEDVARGMAKAVRVRAVPQVNDIMPMSKRDMSRFEAGERAWREALTAAGMSLDDLGLVETHDCFTIAELIEYEAMGLTPHGEGERAILEGWTHKDGKLPINPSGGLKAKGHPIGATGVSMHVICAMQLTGTAGDMQIPGVETAGIFNMGGAAVANYVTILERAH